MNDPEFDEWYREHCLCFPGLIGWMKKFNDEFRKGIIRKWKKILFKVDVKSAILASEEMGSREDLQKIARYYEKHPATIRRVAGQLSSSGASSHKKPEKYVDGERAYDCVRCRDEGLVIVLDRHATIELLKGTPWEELGSNRRTSRYLTTVTVACLCDMGEPFRRSEVMHAESQQKADRSIYDERDFEMIDKTHWDNTTPPAGLVEHIHSRDGMPRFQT